MSETHQIAGAPQGEPLASDRVGARVRFPLSGGAPSPRWSRALGAQLTNELSGHAAVGHLRLGELVQGNDLVLEGVEEREAPDLGACLARAVAAANACVADDPSQPANMPPARAEEIAAQVRPTTG
jgi:hypothetical protein